MALITATVAVMSADLRFIAPPPQLSGGQELRTNAIAVAHQRVLEKQETYAPDSWAS